MIWKPHVTVAAVIERNGRFLMVEEACDGGIRFNQPAGHLEKNEALTDAVRREVMEETAWRFLPEALVGIHLWRRTLEAPTFLRVTFCGRVVDRHPSRTLDDEIIATHWLTREELAARGGLLRSPLVLNCIDDYLAGERYPLSLLKTLIDH